MVSSIGGIGSGGGHRVGESSGTAGQINMLLKRIKVLQKQIAALKKELQNSTDPAERMRLIKEIVDLEHFVQMLEHQISQLESNEHHKQKNRAAAKLEQEKDRDEE